MALLGDMARTAKITLDGVDYTVHAFNIGQLEQVSEIFEGPKHRVPYALLRIAMERAEPKLNGSFEEVSPTFDEINEAFRTITELSGIKTTNPPEPVAPAAS